MADMLSTNILLALITNTLVFYPHLSQAKIASGLIETTSASDNWRFISRYCFLSKAGRLEFEFTYPVSYDEGINAAQNILLYHDIQWPYVYSEESSSKRGDSTAMTCDEKEGYLVPENHQVINLTTRYKWSGCKIEDIGGIDWYRCRGGRTFSSSRERWWYLVVSNCQTTKGLFLNYSITMTNDLEDNLFFKHFSADEFYILQETIAFLLIYTLLMTLSIYVAYSLHLRQFYHTTYKMYMWSLCLEYAALIAQIIYWTDYAVTGHSRMSWKNLGRFLEFAGQAVFLILLVLMGKGYTITRGRISTGGVIKILVVSSVYIAMTIVMLIWEASMFDPGMVLYIYDSIPGYILIAVKIASWLWFLYAIFFTVKHYEDKLSFYIPFLILYTIWFWAASAVALAAIDAIPRWMKEKVVQGCLLLVTFLGHLIFLILTWPTMAGRTFPYHIKTTQVGAMELTASPSASHGNGEPSAIGGAYGPTDSRQLANSFEPIGERQFIDMFTTDHTRSSRQTHMVNPDRFPHESNNYNSPNNGTDTKR